MLAFRFASARLMEYFLDHAKDNTEKGLDTCRILGAFLTHLSQSCFISSVDWHTLIHIRNYGQHFYLVPLVMIPEAFAIVTAPTDTSRYAATLNTKFSRYALNKIWQFHRGSVRLKSLKCSISFHLYFGSQALDDFFHSLGAVLAFVLVASLIFDNNGSTLGCGH
ncbi:hypothetical protein ACFXTH_011570 [Malus domestica]